MQAGYFGGGFHVYEVSVEGLKDFKKVYFLLLLKYQSPELTDVLSGGLCCYPRLYSFGLFHKAQPPLDHDQSI